MANEKHIRSFLDIFLSLRSIMLIGSIGAIMGSVLMFLQGTLYLYEAWHAIIHAGRHRRQTAHRAGARSGR